MNKSFYMKRRYAITYPSPNLNGIWLNRRWNLGMAD